MTTPKTVRLDVTISTQAEALLEELAAMGIFGLTVPEVARRFIDAAPEVARRFIDAALVQKVAEGFVKLPKEKK